jgi:hypothetical protein
MATSIDRRQVDRWLSEGLSLRQIAGRLGLSWTTFWRQWQRLQLEASPPVHGEVTAMPAPSGPPPAHQGTPAADHTRHTQAHPSTPAVRQRHTRAHLGTPATHPTRVHPGTPAEQPTQVHQGTPLPPELARMLSLLPEIEALVARERDRQRLLSTPIGTPRHTVKKTYVVDTLYVDLIERYAQAEGLELKAVLNLALHEFFERRHYLPEEA